MILWALLLFATSLCFAKEGSSESSTSAKDYYVWNLPGLDKSTTKFHTMHSGNIVVKPEHHGSLFFWNFDSQYVVDKPRTVLWLNGGPGCSSEDGALMEIGPYRVNKDKKLVDNEESWNKYANLLFVDQPMGVGFSSVDTDSYIHELPEMADDMMTFLDKYFEIFPDKLNDEFFIAGESYAGQYIPYLAKAIIDRNNDKSNNKKKHPNIDLQGILIGNGWVDPVQHYLSYLPYAYAEKLIDQGSPEANRIEALHRDCAETLSDMGNNVTIHVKVCEKVINGILDVMKVKTGGEKCLNIYDIRLTDEFPQCGMNWPPDLEYIVPYLRDSKVLKALHTYSEGNSGWKECSGAVGDAFEAKTSKPSIDLIPEITKHIEVLFYNGDKDLICNHIGNEKFLENLEWNGEQGFGAAQVEKWMGGEVTSARNISYVKVKDSSHMLPFDHPKEAQFILHSFLGVQSWSGESKIASSVAAGGTKDDGDDSKDGDKEKDKAVEDAKWKAYYQAGSAALVVLLLILAIGGYFLWRANKRQNEREEYLPSGNMRDNNGSGLFNSFINGLLRWKPNKKNRSASGGGASGRYFGLNPRRQRPSHRNMNDERDGIILEEEEEYELQSPESAGSTELEEVVVQRPEGR